MQKNKLFNPDGDKDSSNRSIIQGNTTNLFELNNIKYDWAMKLYRAFLANFWIPEEIPLGNDSKDYRKLSAGEQDAYDKVISFLVFLDSLQTSNLPTFSKYITAPEVNLCLQVQAFQEGLHCYEDGTEILTENGWVDFNLLSDTERVANYNSDGSITFEFPSEIIHSDYEGSMFRFSGQRYNLSVTPNHRMVKFDQYANWALRIDRADKVSVHNHRLPVSGRGIGELDNFTPEDQLYVAFQADGTPVNGGSQTEEGDYLYRFFFHKQRKADQLLKILEDGEFRYTYKVNEEGHHSIYVWTSRHMDKDFDQVPLASISENWARDFIQETTYWDGCRSGGILRYTNSNKKAVDKVVAVAALANMRTNFYKVPVGSSRPPIRANQGDVVTKKEHYQITISDTYYVSGRSVSKEEFEYKGKIHCVTVPSGMVIVRKNGMVSVSGNSQSYGYILDTVVSSTKRDKIYNYWRDDEILKKRNMTITSYYENFENDPSDDNFVLAVLANYLLEGLYFYSGFAFFYTLARQDKMNGTAQVIRYINKDELSHLVLFQNIIRTLREENPELFDSRRMVLMKNLIKDAVESEIEWGQHVISGGVLGLTDDIIEKYIKYLANQRMRAISFEEPYPDFKEHPIKWVDTFAKVNEIKTDFFEAKPTSYSKASSLDWDDFDDF